MIPFVSLMSNYGDVKSELDAALLEVFDSGHWVGGKCVSDFENAFSDYLGVNHCISCANGSDALELALKALDIGMGDEVLVPAVSWVATAAAVSNVGAIPVFVDIIHSEYTMDVSQIQDFITSRTKAVIPVHLYGMPARMEEILRIAQEYHLKVIEDCAQAHGSCIKGRKVGTFGDIACFSFYPTKNLGALGDAGCVVTKNDELALRVRRLSDHGQLKKHDHKEVGRNSKMDPIQAVILRNRLERLDQCNETRIALAHYYNDVLPSTVQKKVVSSQYRHVYHLYTIEVDDRLKLIEKFTVANIGYGIHYPKPLPLLHCYSHYGYQKENSPIADSYCKRTISLPIYPNLDKKEIDRVVAIIYAHLQT